MPSGLSTPDHSGTWSARSTISWLISPHEPLGELREGVGAHAVRRGDREVEEGAEDEEEGAQVHARERLAAVEEQEGPQKWHCGSQLSHLKRSSLLGPEDGVVGV